MKPERTFQDWLRQKYVEWRGDRVRANQTEFARYIGGGVTRQDVSNILNLGRRVGLEKVHAIAHRLGRDVYDVLGISEAERRDAALSVVIDLWEGLTDEQKRSIVDEAERAAASRSRHKPGARVPAVAHRRRG